MTLFSPKTKGTPNSAIPEERDAWVSDRETDDDPLLLPPYPFWRLVSFLRWFAQNLRTAEIVAEINRSKSLERFSVEDHATLDS